MAPNNDQILLWAKTKMFGDWAPEDQEWGIQEFLRDKGWSVDNLATAIKNGRFEEHSNYWFKTKGHAKAKARNEARDQSGGYLPGDPRYTTPEQREKAKNDADRTAAEARTAKINADIDAFYQELAKPLDPNDPEVMRVASMAGRQAAGESFGRGIEGGLAVENTQRMAGDAAANLFAQERARRQGLQANLGQLRSQTGLSQQDYLDRQRQFGVEQQRYRDDRNYANEIGQWMQRQQQGQAVGSIVGGGLGAIAGIKGGPAGIGLGLSAGSGLGGGIGGLAAGGPPPRRFNSGGW